jgi:hypothetical protein
VLVFAFSIINLVALAQPEAVGIVAVSWLDPVNRAVVRLSVVQLSVVLTEYTLGDPPTVAATQFVALKLVADTPPAACPEEHVVGVPAAPVALIVPEPETVRLAPEPTTIAAEVFVPLVSELNAELPPVPQEAPASASSTFPPETVAFTQFPFVGALAKAPRIASAPFAYKW